MAPIPPAPGTPRPSRDGPRERASGAAVEMGAPKWPPYPQRSARPGEAGTGLGNARAGRLLRWGPRNGPHTPSARRAPAEPGRASDSLTTRLGVAYVSCEL